ncbi:MAG: hypothetical protein IJS87_00860 [Rhodocyclaceae bacterium]|nr:hypothetical protein [Rhodocyclaceae bacterium]
MESFDPIFFAVIPAGAGMVSSWCDMRADMRPGAEGKTLYRVAATLCGLATVATSVMIFVPAFSLSEVMLIAFCAVYTWQLALLAASSACKARLGAQLKRFGDIRFFQQGQTIRAAQDAALRQGWHPRGWLPFYHPWRQYRRKTITRSEFATACLAHAALITLALWLPIEVDRVGMAACYFLIANGFFLSANTLGKDGPDTAQASRKRTLYATSSLLFSVYFIALGALNTYLATLTEAFFADLLADLQEEGISRQALRELYFLPDIGLPAIAAALCCIPFFALRIFHECRRTQTVQQARTLTLQLLRTLLWVALAISAAWGQFLFLYPHTRALELLLISAAILFHAQRKLAFFLVFQHLRPLWQDRRAWRTAYLRARASWLPEGVMALLAVAPFLRFLAHSAAPDPLEIESVAANANLALCICLVLPLALRLGRRAMRR